MKKTNEEWVEYFKVKYPDLCDLNWDNLYIPGCINILHDRAKFMETVDFDRVEEIGIARLVIYCFDLVKDKIPWEKLQKDDLAFALRVNPKIVKYCHLDSLDQFHWGFILPCSPELIEYCPVATIDSPMVPAAIIRRQKHLASYFSAAMLEKAAEINAELDQKQPE